MKTYFTRVLFASSCISAPVAASIRLGSPKAAPNDEHDDAMVQHRHHCKEWKDQDGAYEALSAKEKEECVTKMVMATKGQRAELLDDVTFTSLMDTRDLALNFGPPGDKLPYDIKAFHTVGLVASIEYESTGDHEYTGLFEGAPYGVARLGSVHGHYQVEANGGMLGGASFKFFKDGMVSGDLLTSPNFPQISGNFFEQDLIQADN